LTLFLGKLFCVYKNLKNILTIDDNRSKKLTVGSVATLTMINVFLSQQHKFVGDNLLKQLLLQLFDIIIFIVIMANKEENKQKQTNFLKQPIYQRSINACRYIKTTI